MGKYANWLLGAAFVLVIAIFILTVRDPGHYLQAAEPFKANMIEAAAGVATALFVVAAFMERGLAVVNSLLFGDEQRAAIIQLSSTDDTTVTAGVVNLAEVMGKKERLRLLVGFVVGLLTSAAGIRTLAGLVDPTTPTDWLFEPMDVLLTAGLLAGGSNSLALLAQVFKDKLRGEAGAPSSRLRTLLATTT